MVNMTWQKMLENHSDLGVQVVADITTKMEGNYCLMTTPDLHHLFWEAFKSVENVRPRWMSADDRDGMLCWFCFELFPSQIEKRAKEARLEEEWIADAEEKERLQNAPQVVLPFHNESKYDHLDPSLGG